MQVLLLLATFVEEEDTLVARPLRNGYQKNSNVKVKKVWIEKSKVTNPQGPKKIWVPKSTWILFCRVQKRISGSWIVNAQDTWPGMNPSLLSLQRKNGGYVTFGDNAKERIIGQGNIGNDTSSLTEIGRAHVWTPVT